MLTIIIFIIIFIRPKYNNNNKIRALSLIGKVPNCQLGWSQFKSGRARKVNTFFL